MSYVTIRGTTLGAVLADGNGGGWRRFPRLWIRRGEWSASLNIGLNVWGLGFSIGLPDQYGRCRAQLLVGPIAFEVGRG